MMNQIFNPDDFSFKTSGIKANEFIMAINTLSGKRSFILDNKGKEYLLEGNVDNTQIGQALLDCLDASRRVLPIDDMDLFDYKQSIERYKNWVSRLQEFVGFKSKAKLFRPMFSLTVIEQNGTIFIQPSRQEKPEAWDGESIAESDYIQVSKDSSPEKIGAAVRLALMKCKSAFGAVLNFE
ncbi:MAG: hypothetical protein RIQ74_243 [Pseudomonadota bacterium]|jgi:hypothetical protein